MTIGIDIVERGAVYQCDRTSGWKVAYGSRCATTGNGDLVCSFSLSSALGVNDAVPALSRSTDGGKTWSAPAPVWPELQENVSMMVNISAGPDGRLYLYGILIPIDRPGETYWSDANQGIKQNQIVWAVSKDDGRSWTPPTIIPRPTVPGSCEAPGPMLVTSKNVWLAPFAPYNSYDVDLKVDRAQIAVMRSADEGKTWQYSRMLDYSGEPDSGGAEAWVTELADGRLLGAAWHMNVIEGTSHPNKYAISNDSGATWSPTRSTGTMGNTVALAPLTDGRALFAHVMRRPEETGIALAVAKPTADDFGIQGRQLVFDQKKATQSGGDPNHTQFTDFAFGEPSLNVLANGDVFMTYWTIEPEFAGIRRLRMRVQ